MAELWKDPYFNIWHGTKTEGDKILGVVVKRLGKKAWTVTTADHAGQFRTKAQAFKAAQRYLDEGAPPYDDPNNLARFWNHD